MICKQERPPQLHSEHDRPPACHTELPMAPSRDLVSQGPAPFLTGLSPCLVCHSGCRALQDDTLQHPVRGLLL